MSSVFAHHIVFLFYHSVYETKRISGPKHRDQRTFSFSLQSGLNRQSTLNSDVDLGKRKTSISPNRVVGWSYEYFSHSIHNISSSDCEIYGQIMSCVHSGSEKQPVGLIGSQPYGIPRALEDLRKINKLLLSLRILGGKVQKMFQI